MQHCEQYMQPDELVQGPHRDFPAAFHDSQEGIQQASQGFTICILTVAGEQSHKVLHGVLLSEAGL